MLRYGIKSGQEEQIISRLDSNGHSVKLQHHPCNDSAKYGSLKIGYSNTNSNAIIYFP